MQQDAEGAGTAHRSGPARMAPPDDMEAAGGSLEREGRGEQVMGPEALAKRLRQLRRSATDFDQTSSDLDVDAHTAIDDLSIRLAELLEAGRALEERNQRLSAMCGEAEAVAHQAALLDSSPDAIIGGTAEGAIVSWNGGAELLFGYTPDEVLGQDISVLLPPDRAGEAAHILDRLADEGEPLQFESRRVRKDGCEVDVSLTISPVVDESGRLLGTSVVARDITEQNRLLRALRESEHRFQQLVDHLDEVFWITTQDASRVFYASPSFDRVWGRDRRELYARPTVFMETVHPADRHEVLRGLVANREGDQELEYRIVTPAGDVRRIRTRSYLLPAGSDGARRIVGVSQDVTDECEAAERTRRDQAQLRSLASELVMAEERERRRLAENLHDDLDQTLTLVQIRLRHLLASASDDSIEQPVLAIDSLVEQALESVRSMTFELSPPILYDLGLTPALEWLADDIGQRYGPGGRHSGWRGRTRCSTSGRGSSCSARSASWPSTSPSMRRPTVRTWRLRARTTTSSSWSETTVVASTSSASQKRRMARASACSASESVSNISAARCS